tara:strand:- start:207 stop:650 length:444 start_codon:yes stop_codon:yes gene_type:complete
MQKNNTVTYCNEKLSHYSISLDEDQISLDEKIEIMHTMITLLRSITNVQMRKIEQLEKTIDLIIEEKMNKLFIPAIQDSVRHLNNSSVTGDIIEQKEELNLSFYDDQISDADHALQCLPSDIRSRDIHKYLNALHGSICSIASHINK